MSRRFLTALALLMTSGAAPPGGAIEVAVSGIESARGIVHVEICPQDGFLKPDCRWSADAPAIAGTTIVTIDGVPPGQYAAQAYHDVNADHKANRNLLGFPTERVGFSNDAPVHLAPPRWHDAVFGHGTGRQRIAFTVRSLP